MAKNYVAKTVLHGNTRKVLSNKEFKDGKYIKPYISEFKPKDIPMNIDLPNVASLDLKKFTPYYSANDTKKEHPYYMYFYKTPGSKVKGNGYKTEKLKIDGMVTLFDWADAMEIAKVGLAPDDFMGAPYQLTNENCDYEKYSVVATYDYSNAVPCVSGVARKFDGNSYKEFKTLNYTKLVRQFIDGKVRGIPPIPEIIDGKTYLNIGCNYTNTNGTVGIYFGSGKGQIRLEPSAFSNVQMTNYRNHYLDCCSLIRPTTFLTSTTLNLFQSSILDFNEGQSIGHSTNIKGTPCFWFFLFDGTDIWIMTASMNSEKWGPNNEMEGTVSYCLHKIKDIPKTSTNASEAPGIIRKNFTWGNNEAVERIIDLLGKIEKVKDKYDGNGPDPVGPGDPYEGDSGNADVSTPTKPNMKDDITKDDATPNEDFNKFMVQSGIFGAYLLTPTSLQKYSQTLEMLYENSKGLWHGSDASFWADRLQNSVTGLFMLPVDVTNGTYSKDAKFVVGNTPVADNKDFNAYTDGTNYTNAFLVDRPTYVNNIDMGILNRNYDSFLDFMEYSKASLFLPYHSKVDLPLNLIQSTSTEEKHMVLSVRLDIYTGNIQYVFIVDGMPLCQWSANCAKPIPLSVSDVRTAVNDGIGKISAAIGATTTTVNGLASGSPLTGIASGLQQQMQAEQMSVTSGGVHMIGNDGVGGSTGWLGEQDIILTVERPEAWRPDNWGNMVGYPTKKIFRLSEATGFIQVEDIKLKCNATDGEKQELKNILRGGILL